LRFCRWALQTKFRQGHSNTLALSLFPHAEILGVQVLGSTAQIEHSPRGEHRNPAGSAQSTSTYRWPAAMRTKKDMSSAYARTGAAYPVDSTYIIMGDLRVQ
jgi:hypothetical protein